MISYKTKKVYHKTKKDKFIFIYEKNNLLVRICIKIAYTNNFY